jgi:RNA polymerase sigma-70 factor (ECF subfamily)
VGESAVPVTEVTDQVAGDEAALVARIASGDRGAAVAELYGRYGRRLFRFGVQALGDNGLAEEMVQEIFVRLWRTAGRFDAEKASVGTYLYVLARSVAADIRKRPSSRPVPSLDNIDLPDRHDFVDQVLDALVIREAFESLGAAHAQVLRLAHEGGLTQSQIAERLGLPLGTVKTRTYHGLKALRSALAARGFYGLGGGPGGRPVPCPPGTGESRPALAPAAA